MPHATTPVITLLAAFVLGACQTKSKHAEMTDSTEAPAAATAAMQADAPQSAVETARSAAPKTIVDDATIMSAPQGERGQMTQVRTGTNGWTCIGASASFDAMCTDRNFESLLKALMAKKDPQVKDVGFAYMLQGDSVGASNTDPFATAPTADNHWVKAPPHIMVVLPDTKSLDAFPAEPNSGGPWVMWKGTKYAHLMVPVR
ncbi:MAG TPA: hypothetical protein VFW89_08725 [Gemmatimonadaceae bacterium]|nr:hypothetical protein [Gemmatimonadaceae bacterium]